VLSGATICSRICPAKTAFSFGNCLTCSDEKAIECNPDDISISTTCEHGYQLEPLATQCTRICPVGKSLASDNVCINCLDMLAEDCNPENPALSITCIFGYLIKPGDSICSSACPEGEAFVVTGECQSCSDQYALECNPNNIAISIRCRIGYQISIGEHTCSSKCEDGSKLSSNLECIKCSDPNALSCSQDNEDISTECKESYTLSTTTSRCELQNKSLKDFILKELKDLEYYIDFPILLRANLTTNEIDIEVCKQLEGKIPPKIKIFTIEIKQRYSMKIFPQTILPEVCECKFRIIEMPSNESDINFKEKEVMFKIIPKNTTYGLTAQNIEKIGESINYGVSGVNILGGVLFPLSGLTWSINTFKVYGLMPISFPQNFKEIFLMFAKINSSGFISQKTFDLFHPDEDIENYNYIPKNNEYSFFGLFYAVTLASTIVKILSCLMFFALYGRISKPILKKILFQVCFSFSIPNLEINLLIAGANISIGLSLFDQLMIFLDLTISVIISLAIYTKVSRNAGLKFSNIPANDAIILKTLSSKKNDDMVFDSIIYFSQISTGMMKSLSWILLRQYPTLLVSTLLFSVSIGLILTLKQKSITKIGVFVTRVAMGIAEILLCLLLLAVHLINRGDPSKSTDNIGVAMIFCCAIYFFAAIIQTIVNIVPNKGNKVGVKNKSDEGTDLLQIFSHDRPRDSLFGIEGGPIPQAHQSPITTRKRLKPQRTHLGSPFGERGRLMKRGTFQGQRNEGLSIQVN